MSDLIISIIKNRKRATCSYGNYLSYKNILRLIKRLITNYNKHLARPDIPEELLFLRMFEEEDLYGRMNKTKPIIFDESHEYMKRHYKSYNIEGNIGRSLSLGEIAILDEDILEQFRQNSEEAAVIAINFDEGYIDMSDDKLIGLYIMKEYMDINGISSIDDITLSYTDIDFFYLKFNELDEAFEFANANKKGWIYDGMIYEPITR